MDKVVKYLKYAIAIVGGVLTGLLGGWDMMLQVLVFIVILDYATGLAAAWVEKTLNSEIGARGILKKVLLFVVVILAYQLDRAIGQEVFRSLAIWFYLANEGLSIIENCARAGLPIPASIRTALEQLKKKGDTGEEVSSPSH